MPFVNTTLYKLEKRRQRSYKSVIRKYFRPDLYDALCAEKKRKIIFHLKPGLVLDAGCGNGWLSLAAHEQGFPVVSLDTSTRAIKECSRIEDKKNDLFFVRASLTSLPFKARVFNSVICADVLEHIPDTILALSAIYMALKSEGRLCVSLPNGLNYGLLYERITFSGILRNLRLSYDTSKAKDLLKEGLDNERELCEKCGHVHRFTNGNLERLLTKVGFKIIEWQNLGFVYSYVRSFLQWLGIHNHLFERILKSDLKASSHLPSVIGENWVIICSKKSLREDHQRLNYQPCS